MRYTGKLFYPADATLRLDLQSLSPIQGHTAYQLYGQFKREMGAEEFDARIDAENAAEPVLLRFRRVGQTAAYAAFAGGAEDLEDAGSEARSEAPSAARLDAVLVLLARLDEAEDERV